MSGGNGKRMREALAKVDGDRQYAPSEAIKLLQFSWAPTLPHRLYAQPDN